MRTWICAAVVAGVLGLLMPMTAHASNDASRAAPQVGSERAITDVSARHRGRPHAQRSVRGHKYRAAHRQRGARGPVAGAQPYGARPDGMAPFFPFGFGGYGFQPSW